MALDTTGGGLLILEHTDEESCSLWSVAREATQTDTILGPRRTFTITYRNPGGEDWGKSQRRRWQSNSTLPNTLLLTDGGWLWGKRTKRGGGHGHTVFMTRLHRSTKLASGWLLVETAIAIHVRSAMRLTMKALVNRPHLAVSSQPVPRGRDKGVAAWAHLSVGWLVRFGRRIRTCGAREAESLTERDLLVILTPCAREYRRPRLADIDGPHVGALLPILGHGARKVYLAESGGFCPQWRGFGYFILLFFSFFLILYFIPIPNFQLKLVLPI